jgi:hypothetical protein
LGKQSSHYRILEKLGSGGMGVKAEDTKLGRVVAIKLLGEHLLGDKAEQARLLHEARTASRLNHAHICTIYEVGEIDDQTYIVMECLEGTVLSALARPTGLPAETVARYGAQIADALNHAHERGVIHRDAQHILCKLEQRRKREYISALHIAAIYLRLGKRDRGIEWSGEACNERAALVGWIHRNPLIATDDVRNDPRFADVMHRIGISYGD